MRLTEELCDDLFLKLDLRTKQHLLAFSMEMKGAEEKHPYWPTEEANYDGQAYPKGDFLHAAAIVAEESGELIKAAVQFAHEGGQYYAMHTECIQTGAMCLRFLNNAPDLPLEFNDTKPRI